MFQDSDNYNQVLTTYAQGAFQNPGAVLDVAALLFPTVVVEEFDGNFYKYDPSAAFRAIDTRMARNNTPVRIEQKKTRGTWECEPEAIETPTFKVNAATKMGMANRKHNVKMLTSSVWTTRQQEAIDILYAAVPVQSDLGAWEGAEGKENDPVEDLKAAIWKVGKGCARDANTILFGPEAWDKLKTHPKVLERIHGQKLVINEKDLAEMLENVHLRICVADTRIDREGNGEFEHLLTNDVVVYFSEPVATEDDQSFGKCFTPFPGGPELTTYEDKGVYVVDSFFWADDKQATNPQACVRFNVKAA